MPTNKYYELIENAPSHLESTAHLFHEVGDYDSGRAPLHMFLDLIGYSAEEYGCNIFDWSDISKTAGYMELDDLANALKEYAHAPTAVNEFIEQVIAAETEEEAN